MMFLNLPTFKTLMVQQLVSASFFDLLAEPKWWATLQRYIANVALCPVQSELKVKYHSEYFCLDAID